MGATTKTNVLIVAPELSTVEDDAWTLVLADVASEISASVYGSKQEMAQRYLAAHYLTLISMSADAKQTSGPVSSETVGQVSKSYAQVNYRDRNRFDETVYGRMFNQLRAGCMIGFTVITP